MPSKALMRIEVESNKAERELRQFQRELDKLKGNMSQLTQAAGLNVAALTKMGGALALVQGASKVVKDAFSQMETRADAFERTIAGVMAGYETFLSTLNGGNWQNFFQNLSTAVQGARDLADAFDRLDSIKGNNAPAIAGLQETIQELRTRQDAGEDVTAQMKAAVSQLQRLQQQAVTQGKNTGRDAIIEAVTNGYQSMQGAGRLARSTAERFADEYLNGGQATMDKYARMYEDLQRRGTKMTTYSQYIGTSSAGFPMSQQVTAPRFSLSNLSKQDQINYNFAKAITEYEAKIREGGAVWTAASQEGRGMFREQHKGNAYTLKGASRGSGKTKKEDIVYEEGSIGAQEKKIKDLTDAWRKAADDDSRAKISAQLKEAQAELERMEGKVKAIPEGSIKALENELQKLQKEQELATSPEAWKGYEDRIKGVQSKIDEMKGEVKDLSQFTQNNIQQLISTTQAQLAQAEIGSALYDNLTRKLADAKALSGVIEIAVKNGIDTANFPVEEFYNKLFGNGDIPDEAWQKVEEGINQKLQGSNKSAKINTTTGDVKEEDKKVEDQFGKFSNDVSKFVGGVSSIASGFKQMGVELPKGVEKVINVMQGLSAIISGVHAIIEVFSTGTEVANTAALAINTGVVAANTVAVGALTTALAINTTSNFIPFFSNGGIVHAANGIIVPGTSYSGDRVPAMVNSGELILNRAQQDNLASQLTDNGVIGGSNGPSYSYVRGEDIYVALNNHLRRTGHGELVTWR